MKDFNSRLFFSIMTLVFGAITLKASTGNATSQIQCVTLAGAAAPVIESRASWFYIHDGMDARTITVYADGRVQVSEHYVKWNPDHTTDVHQVRRESSFYYTADVMEKIARARGSLRAGELIDQSPDAPRRVGGGGDTLVSCDPAGDFAIARRGQGHDYYPALAQQKRAAKYLQANMDILLKAIESENDRPTP